MPTLQVAEEAVRAFRAQRTHLVDRGSGYEIEDVARALGGVQAQVHSAAQLALCTRTDDVCPTDIEKALWQRGTLLRTWTLRGTLHLISARDVAVMLRARSGQALAREKRWLSEQGIPDKDIDRVLQEVGEVLADEPLTRAELTEALARRCGEQLRPLVDHSWGGIVKTACMSGIAHCGPPRGREVTFARLDIPIPSRDELPPEEALACLLRRHLRAYGPARVRDFAHWSGVGVREARAALDRLDTEVAEVRVGDRPHLLLTEDVPKIEEMEPLAGVVRLLPAFDVTNLAHRDKDLLIDEKHYRRVFGAGGWIRPSLFVDGRILGTWSHSVRVRVVDIEVQPFAPLSEWLRELIVAEAGRLESFFNREVSLSVTAP